MDIKSIVRAFRYGQLNAKAASDPEAKVPPTIKFLVSIVVVGIALSLLALFWLNNFDQGPSSNVGGALEVPSASGAANNTTQAPAPDGPPQDGLAGGLPSLDWVAART